MDPCELRLAKGDTAVSDLVASRVPLVEFAIRAGLAGFDLETAEGRVQAMKQAAPLVAKIKDRSLRPEYARRLAGWLGMEVEAVTAAVADASGDKGGAPRRAAPEEAPVDVALVRLEREALKLAVQTPFAVAPIFDELHEDVFTDPRSKAVHEVVRKAGGVSTAPGGEDWVAALLAECPDDAVRQTLMALAVEAPLTDWELPRYGQATLSQLQMHAAERRVKELKGRLQRVNPVEEEDLYHRTYAELISLEKTVRAFREAGISSL
jgi:DNA primase